MGTTGCTGGVDAYIRELEMKRTLKSSPFHAADEDWCRGRIQNDPNEYQETSEKKPDGEKGHPQSLEDH